MKTVGTVFITPGYKPELGDVAKDKEGSMYVWDGTSWRDRAGQIMSEDKQLEAIWHAALPSL